jgi:hypothetical protein
MSALSQLYHSSTTTICFALHTTNLHSQQDKRTADWLSKVGVDAAGEDEAAARRRRRGVVRKSKFSSEETADGAAPLELDDPDFWRKVLPDLVTPQTVLDRLEVCILLHIYATKCDY